MIADRSQQMRGLVALLSFAAILSAGDVKGTPEDEQAVRKAVADGTAAFNNKQVISTSDFDVVVPPGTYAKMGAGFEERVMKDFKTVFKNARETSTVDRIRFIRPDVALVDGTFEIAGTDIKPDPKGLQTLVFVKENGKWVAAALRRMIPVRPLPGTPGAQQ
jgi:ketosteroid isomerase-like protein